MVLLTHAPVATVLSAAAFGAALALVGVAVARSRRFARVGRGQLVAMFERGARHG